MKNSKLAIAAFIIAQAAFAQDAAPTATVVACCACSKGAEVKERFEITEVNIREARATCSAGSTAELKCSLLPNLTDCK